MLSFANLFNGLLFKLLTVIFTGFLAIPSLPSGLFKELPKAGDDFTPVIRFAVCSDVHLNGNPEDISAEHLRNMLKDVYAYSDSQAYDKLDAILVAGDFATGNSTENASAIVDSQYELFNQITGEGVRAGTEIFCVLGNHEFINFRDYDPHIAYEKYQKYICKDVDRHLVINGYHIIGVSYDDDAYHFTGKKKWLKNELKAAAADTPDKPIFVFNHPHPFATVYGSVSWSDFDLRTVLSQFPQVIDFSGHSHYAANDPRSIWQESFTAVGSGSLCCQMSCLDYLTGGQDATGESGVFWIVEGDANGNVRLKLYDVVSHCFFEDADYYLENTSKLTGRRYTWNNLKSLDTAPEFPQGATVTASKDENGNLILSYPDAKGYFPAESYKINVYSGAKSVASGSFDSNYVRAIRDGVVTNVGKVDAGTYTVTVTPCSPYAKTGNAIKATITVD